MFLLTIRYFSNFVKKMTYTIKDLRKCNDFTFILLLYFVTIYIAYSYFVMSMHCSCYDKKTFIIIIKYQVLKNRIEQYSFS